MQSDMFPKEAVNPNMEEAPKDGSPVWLVVPPTKSALMNVEFPAFFQDGRWRYRRVWPDAVVQDLSGAGWIAIETP